MLMLKMIRRNDEGKIIREKDYTYRLVGDGLKKCMCCGMILANDEVYTHGAYHKSFTKVEVEHPEILSEYGVEKYIRDIKEIETEDDLECVELLEFTNTLRSWDYVREGHPNFEDYRSLLWSTEEFKEEIKRIVPEWLYQARVEEYSSNRCLRVVGDYSLISIKECEGIKDLSKYDEHYLREEEIEVITDGVITTAELLEIDYAELEVIREIIKPIKTVESEKIRRVVGKVSQMGKKQLEMA